MTGYLEQNNLLLEFQSAYRHHDSTESAMLKVFSDIIYALDRATSFCSPFLTCQLLSILWTTISFVSSWQGHLGFELSHFSGWIHIWLVVLSQFTWMKCLLHLGTSCAGPARFRARATVVQALHGWRRPHHSRSQSPTPLLFRKHAIKPLLYTAGKCVS